MLLKKIVEAIFKTKASAAITLIISLVFCISLVAGVITDLSSRGVIAVFFPLLVALFYLFIVIVCVIRLAAKEKGQ